MTHQILESFLDEYDVEVIMIRFTDDGNFQEAVKSLLNSPYWIWYKILDT